MSDSGGEDRVGSAWTALREAEEKLRHAERLAAVGQLAGGIAHDFNNQLSAILGYAELLRRKLPPDSPALRYADSIIKAAERSAHLNQQLLAFARRGKPHVGAVDLNRVVDAVVTLLSHSLDKRIAITKELSARPAEVVGDAAQLQGALVNLALNARDAMPAGGELSFATEVVALEAGAVGPGGLAVPPGSYVRVRVRDTGVGMDDATLRRVFEPLFTTKAGQGPGLGLPSVYGIVASHNGTLTVDSALGKGATFELLLPHSPSTAEAIAAERASARPSARLRILLAEDEPLVRDAAIALLQSLGHEVTPCKDGRAAVEVFGERWRDLDLVLLDMVMPELSGPNVFDRIRAIDPGAKVLLSSGYTLDGEAQGLLARGAAGFVQKPYRMDDLARAIARALA